MKHRTSVVALVAIVGVCAVWAVAQVPIGEKQPSSSTFVEEATSLATGVLGASFEPDTEPAETTASTVRYFFGGDLGSHHLSSTAEGSCHYLYGGAVERYELVFEKKDRYFYYAYEKGWPDYRWAFRRYASSDGRVQVWHQRPGVGWTKYHRAEVTSVSSVPYKKR